VLSLHQSREKRGEIGLTEGLDLAFCSIFQPKRRKLLAIRPVNLQSSNAVIRFWSHVSKRSMVVLLNIRAFYPSERTIPCRRDPKGGFKHPTEMRLIRKTSL
jgi:hypothetical protein